MKKTIFFILTLISLSGSACEAYKWYGEGPKETIVGINWQEDNFLFLGLRYSADTISGAEILKALEREEPRLKVDWIYGGEAIVGISWDVDNNGLIDESDWSQEGWDKDGYWSYWFKNSQDDWTYSYIGAAQNIHVRSYTEVWSWGDGQEAPNDHIHCLK